MPLIAILVSGVHYYSLFERSHKEPPQISRESYSSVYLPSKPNPIMLFTMTLM
jgi:hypothetical protein